jgi:hypothetical protein
MADNNTPWCGNTGGKLYLTSGQYTSTLKTSEDVSGVNTGPIGISTNLVNERLGIVQDIFLLSKLKPGIGMGQQLGIR